MPTPVLGLFSAWSDLLTYLALTGHRDDRPKPTLGRVYATMRGDPMGDFDDFRVPVPGMLLRPAMELWGWGV